MNVGIDKPAWPSEAMVMVCPTARLGVRSMMRSGLSRGRCRECRAEVLYSGYAYSRTREAGRNRGNHAPIALLCSACARCYESSSLNQGDDQP